MTLYGMDDELHSEAELVIGSETKVDRGASPESYKQTTGKKADYYDHDLAPSS